MSEEIKIDQFKLMSECLGKETNITLDEKIELVDTEKDPDAWVCCFSSIEEFIAMDHRGPGYAMRNAEVLSGLSVSELQALGFKARPVKVVFLDE